MPASSRPRTVTRTRTVTRIRRVWVVVEDESQDYLNGVVAIHASRTGAFKHAKRLRATRSGVFRVTGEWPVRS